MTALLARGPDDHEYVFFGPRGTTLRNLADAGFRTVEIALGGARRVAMKAPDLPRLLRTLSTNPMQRIIPLSRMDRAVTSTGIDLLWCLGPDVPSMEVPFALTVWDLQHRLQPYFPEVSANGVWWQRERYYETRLRRAAVVVAGTEAGKAEIERFYAVPPERIVVVPHPTPAFTPAEASDEEVLAKYELEPGYVFYPAQFWPHKNHVGLVHAMAQLKSEGLSLQLVLAGSDWGGNRAHVESGVAALGLNDEVRFLGFVPRSDLPALYRKAGCLAYVSYFGPENLPPMEAFSLGCPVLAARVPGAEEQLGDAAELVDPSDDGAIASAIRRIRDDDAYRQALVERGRERAAVSTPATFVDSVMGVIKNFCSIRRCWD